MSEPVRLLFVGGNGHAPSRLEVVRAALADREEAPFALVDLPLPGFDGRPAPRDLGDLLEFFGPRLAAEQARGPCVLHGTGIGALLLLAARLLAHLDAEVPILAQGPVLWGLEERRFPRLMRAIPGAQRGLAWLLQRERVQRRFVAKHFERPLSDRERAEFFAGYARCPAFGRFFDWLTPSLLRTLEAAAARAPERLRGIRILIGDRDHVVGERELVLTERALGCSLSRRVVEGWGHYPMIDDPQRWVRVLAEECTGVLRAELTP